MAFYTSKHITQWNGAVLLGTLLFCIGCSSTKPNALKRTHTRSATSTQVSPAKKQENASTSTVHGTTGSKRTDPAVPSANTPKAGSSTAQKIVHTGSKSSGGSGGRGGAVKSPVAAGTPLPHLSVQHLFDKNKLLDTLEASKFSAEQKKAADEFIKKNSESNPGLLNDIFQEKVGSYDKTLDAIISMVHKPEENQGGKKTGEDQNDQNDQNKKRINASADLPAFSEKLCFACKSEIKHNENFTHNRIKVHLSCGCKHCYHNECIKKDNGISDKEGSDVQVKCSECNKQVTVLTPDGSRAPFLVALGTVGTVGDVEFGPLFFDFKANMTKRLEAVRSTVDQSSRKDICCKLRFLQYLTVTDLKLPLETKVKILSWFACFDPEHRYFEQSPDDDIQRDENQCFLDAVMNTVQMADRSAVLPGWR